MPRVGKKRYRLTTSRLCVEQWLRSQFDVEMAPLLELASRLVLMYRLGLLFPLQINSSTGPGGELKTLFVEKLKGSDRSLNVIGTFGYFVSSNIRLILEGSGNVSNKVSSKRDDFRKFQEIQRKFSHSRTIFGIL